MCKKTLDFMTTNLREFLTYVKRGSKDPLKYWLHLVNVLTTKYKQFFLDLGCIDRNEKCADYAKWGQCESNERYMLQYCCKTCKDRGKNIIELGN